MNPETWKLVASIGGLLLTIVTGPFLCAIRAESKAIRTEIKLASTQLRAEIDASESRMKEKIGVVSTDMVGMESRLNQRIDTRLVHK